MKMSSNNLLKTAVQLLRTGGRAYLVIHNCYVSGQGLYLVIHNCYVSGQGLYLVIHNCYVSGQGLYLVILPGRFSKYKSSS